MTKPEDRAKEMSRPDGMVIVALDELKNMTSETSCPTASIRYLDGVLQQQFKIETYAGDGKLVGGRHEWRDVPHETVKPTKD